jgi:SAM-dependent methyltransferase
MTEISYVGSELELFSKARNWKAYWASQIRPFIGKQVLDVGAGIGSNLDQLWSEGAQWTCLEPDPNLVADLRVKASALGDSVTVITGTLQDLTQQPEFDTIIYIDVLEHIEHDRAELVSAAKKLVPGGHLVVLSPAFQYLYSPFDDAVGHFRRYTRNSLRSLEPEGLELRHMQYLDCVGALASTSNKLLLRSAQPKPGQIALWDKAMVPLSRSFFDKALSRWFGRSIYGVWQRPQNNAS